MLLDRSIYSLRPDKVVDLGVSVLGRVKDFSISLHVFLQAIMMKSGRWPCRVLEGIPEDGKLVGYRFDYPRLLKLTIEHESFSEVKQGDTIPEGRVLIGTVNPEAILETLEFYGDGETDGGEKARRLFRDLWPDAVPSWDKARRA